MLITAHDTGTFYIAYPCLDTHTHTHTLTTEGESLTTGELDEYTRQVTANTSLQDLVPGSVVGRDPKELLRSIMSANSSVLEKFLGALQDGDYDAMAPKAKVCCGVMNDGRLIFTS